MLRMKAIKTFLYFGVIYLFCKEVETFASVTEGGQLSLASLCPYTRFCTRNASVQFIAETQTRPCCSECSCSRDCRIYGNCCPDYDYYSSPNINTSDEAPTECYFPVHNIKEHVKHRLDNYIYPGLDHYMMVTGCPGYYPYNATRKLCENPPSDVESFLVVSNEKDVAFKNKFCAQCNGVGKFSSWQLKIFCDTSQMAEEFSLSPEYFSNSNIHDDCMVWAWPPSRFPKTSICYRASKTCNHTQQWDAYNPEIERLCGSYTLFYTATEKNTENSIIYQNIHCYLCNSDSTLKPIISNVCDAFTDELKRNNRVVSFTAIINSAVIFSDRKAVKSCKQPCYSHQMYDPLFVSTSKTTFYLGKTLNS